MNEGNTSSDTGPVGVKRSRPVMPDDYGVPQSDDSLLAWSFVDERLSAAQNYWIATTRPDGRPHAVPSWGVWLDDAFYLEGSPETRRFRNLAQNSNVSVHLESGSEVVILEGVGFAVPKPAQTLTLRLAEIFTSKYSASGYSPGPEQWDAGGLYIVHPRLVLAWSQFPKDTTRWIFPNP